MPVRKCARNFGSHHKGHRVNEACRDIQTEVMVEALRRNGNAVGYFLFAGEQHGFRQAANIKRCLDAELMFYAVEVFHSGLTF
jgi:hypothetical protein